MKVNIIMLLILLFSVNVMSQQIALKGDVDISDFPNLEFTVNVYNPDVKFKESFNLKENNIPVAIEVKPLQPNIANKSKTVLILMEDMTHISHKGQIKTFKYILKNSLKEFISEQDKVNLAVFDRNRDGSTPLRFLLKNYTNNPKILLDVLADYNNNNKHFSNNISSDLYNSVYDGITELKKKFSGENKILIVLSAGKNLELSNYNSIETLIQYAKKEKIIVYSMQYMLWEHETIDVLSNETFGKVFHIKGSYNIAGNHSKEVAADSLVSFINSAVERLYGYDYNIKYTTIYERDENLHIATLTIDNNSLNIQFKSPGCNIFCLFKKQPILYGGILFTIIILSIIIIILLKNKKEKKEQLLKKEISGAKEEAIKAQELLEQQKKEIEKKEKKVLINKELEEKERQEKEKEEKLLSEMKKAGVLPSINNVSSGEEYKIIKPQMFFGRKSNNDVMINDEFISGQHFKIFFWDSFYFIEDTGSSNGTMLNGKPIKQSKLNHNDIIEVGNTKLMFRF